MLYPEVKEEIRLKLKTEFDSLEVKGDQTYEGATSYLLEQIITLQNVFSDRTRAPDPQVQVRFGKEAIQPLAAPMQFTFEETSTHTQVRMHMVPWEHSSSSALQELLMREQDKVSLERTLAPLYKFDLDALKRQAACDSLKLDKGMRSMQYELMKKQLDSLQESLTTDSAVTLAPVFMEASEVHSNTSGLFVGFNFTEPPEVSNHEGDDLDQESLKQKLIESQLDDDAEIDELLSKTIDPFIEFDDEPQDIVDSDTLLTKFLNDFKEMQVQQIELDQSVNKKIKGD